MAVLTIYIKACSITYTIAKQCEPNVASMRVCYSLVSLNAALDGMKNFI